jgi:hypothetical protein
MRSPERQMQKAERIENWMRRLPECFEQCRERRLGGTRSLGMAAHPIDDHEKHGLFRGCYRYPVLIFLAMADQAHVRGLDLQ